MDEELHSEITKLTEKMRAIVVGRSTVACMMALSYLLADLEMQMAQPDRKDMFRIIGRGMDAYIAVNRPQPMQ